MTNMNGQSLRQGKAKKLRLQICVDYSHGDVHACLYMAHVVFLPCAVLRCCQQAIRTHERNNPVCSTPDSATDMQQRHRCTLQCTVLPAKILAPLQYAPSRPRYIAL